MSDKYETVRSYIAVWNDPDPVTRRETMQNQFPDCVIALCSTVDAHHNVARFKWQLGLADGEPMIVGFDVMVLAADGRIRDVHGFLDKISADI
ncbi:hypothetical protein ABH926_005383 [Catenulispora sp. GP43]|uniref:nuclear transport factor 2 family protein n=1 Tax=Catenulispora sp. GP43 TaxID=3156263 RepID=UPI0035164D3D